MQCNFCEKQATVHLSQIIHNKVHKIDLCEECAKAKGVDDPIGYSLTGLLAGLDPAESGEPEEMPSSIKCPSCGLTQTDFKKSGRLGCPDCYPVFQKYLEEMLNTMHKGTRHVGKIPVHLRRSIDVTERLRDLEDRLHAAIQEEDYEQAAVLRDEINSLKEKNTDLLTDPA